MELKQGQAREKRILMLTFVTAPLSLLFSTLSLCLYYVELSVQNTAMSNQTSWIYL